jgi:hypothetical protein
MHAVALQAPSCCAVKPGHMQPCSGVWPVQVLAIQSMQDHDHVLSADMSAPLVAIFYCTCVVPRMLCIPAVPSACHVLNRQQQVLEHVVCCFSLREGRNPSLAGLLPGLPVQWGSGNHSHSLMSLSKLLKWPSQPANNSHTTQLSSASLSYAGEPDLKQCTP